MENEQTSDQYAAENLKEQILYLVLTRSQLTKLEYIRDNYYRHLVSQRAKNREKQSKGMATVTIRTEFNDIGNLWTNAISSGGYTTTEPHEEIIYLPLTEDMIERLESVRRAYYTNLSKRREDYYRKNGKNPDATKRKIYIEDVTNLWGYLLTEQQQS